MNTLHILNGDSTLGQFQKTDIKGDTFVWREMLCEGEITSDVGTDLFWKQRQEYLSTFMDDGTSFYSSKFKIPFQSLDLNHYDEVILWFEYDLFCQINLIAVLSWLNNGKIRCKISLICSGEHKNYKKLIGLGEISFEEYNGLYEQREELNKSDLEFGSELWHLYISSNHDLIINKIKAENNPKFKYLLPAFQAHVRRFPSKENGLSEIETNIVKFIQSASKARNQIIREMLLKEDFYGFGDLQYFEQLDNLKPILTEENDQFELNESGYSILRREDDFMKFRTQNRRYGGSSLEDFRWDSENKELIKRDNVSSPFNLQKMKPTL